MRRNWIIKWQLLVLLAIGIPLTTSTKWTFVGRKSFDEPQIQSTVRGFLETHNAKLMLASHHPRLLAPINFTFKACESAVLVLPASDNWMAIIAKRTPLGQIAQFRYRDYVGDVPPSYRVMFMDMYQSVLYPILKEDRREFSLALIATPACMKTIESIQWEEVWTAIMKTSTTAHS